MIASGTLLLLAIAVGSSQDEPADTRPRPLVLTDSSSLTVGVAKPDDSPAPTCCGQAIRRVARADRMDRDRFRNLAVTPLTKGVRNIVMALFRAKSGSHSRAPAG